MTDDFWRGDDGTEPVKKIEHLWAANTGEDIFVAAGKPDDLVREHRADDDDLVVVEKLGVDLDRHVHLEQPSAQVTDLLRGKGADIAERAGVVPGMIEKLNRGVRAGAFVVGDLQPLLDRLLAHRLVRAQRDHHVERGSRPADLVVDGLEHRADRRGARAVGDDQQHLAIAKVLLRHRPGHDVARLFGGEQFAFGNFFGNNPHGVSDGCA